MLKKRTHQLRFFADLLQLFMHTILQFFVFYQRPSGYARTLGMTPHKLVRVEAWRIARQKVQCQTAICFGHIFLDRHILVRRQTIHHQMQRFLAAMQQPLEQFDKQIAREPTLISGEPERAFGIDRRSCADALTLPRPIDHRRFAAQSPSLVMHRIGTKAGFVPEIDFGTFLFGLLCDGQKGIALPTFNGCRIALIGALQRLLRREVEFTSKLPTEVTLKLMLNFWRISTRTISRVYKAKSKPYCIGFLPLTQRNTCDFWARVSLGVRARAFASRQTALAAPAHLGKPFVSRGAAQPIAAHHHRDIFSLKNALHRHHAYGLFGLSIMSAPIFFHERMEFA